MASTRTTGPAIRRTNSGTRSSRGARDLIGPKSAGRRRRGVCRDADPKAPGRAGPDPGERQAGSREMDAVSPDGQRDVEPAIHEKRHVRAERAPRDLRAPQGLAVRRLLLAQLDGKVR